MIYLLEDDGNIREFVLYALNGQGYETVGFDRPSAFWEAVDREQPELVLLDLMLPEEDGLSVLRRLREKGRTKRIPVIILSARGSERDRILGLDGGADDYLPKPFGMLELFSRIRAVLRRSEPVRAPEFRHGDLVVRLSRRQVLIGDREVFLTPKEFDLLEMLLEQPGTVAQRSQIQNRVWGAEYLGETRTVDVHIRTLRQKLGPYGDMVETVRGVGYRWKNQQ